MPTWGNRERSLLSQRPGKYISFGDHGLNDLQMAGCIWSVEVANPYRSLYLFILFCTCKLFLIPGHQSICCLLFFKQLTSFSLGFHQLYPTMTFSVVPFLPTHSFSLHIFVLSYIYNRFLIYDQATSFSHPFLTRKLNHLLSIQFILTDALLPTFISLIAFGHRPAYY